MNKITKNQAQDLMEAYTSIYESSEITEGQIKEYFDLWVNELLEEGCDLSEYTYDDLYEYYLNESWGPVIVNAIRAGLRSGFKLPLTGSVRQALVGRGIEGATRSGAQAIKGLKNIALGSSAKNTGGKRRIAAAATGLDVLFNQGKITKSVGKGLQGAWNMATGGSGGNDSSGTAKPTKPKNPFATAPESLIQKEATDWSSIPGKDWATLTRGTERKIYVPGMGWQFPATINKQREQAGLKPIKDPGQPTPATPAGATKPAPGTPSGSSAAAPAGSSTAAPAAPTRPSGGTPAGSSTAAPAAPTRPATAASQSSPANMSTADKIKSGMGVWGQQMKMGDTKGAADTGMGVWRMANPKLAAAADERARIRGTAQTDNPLMRSFRSRLPMNSPSVQSPDVANLGRGNQSLSQNPNAFRAAEPKTTPAATTQQSQDAAWNRQAARAREARFASSLGGPASIPTSPVNRSGSAATPIKPIVIPQNQNRPTNQTQNRPTSQTQNKTVKSGPTAPSRAPSLLMKQSYEHDAYDIILEYLIDRGHADTLDEANYLMLEMDESAIQSILEEYKNYSLSVEISEWVDNLLDEGYDLSQYQWEELVEYYLNEMS